MKCPYCPARGRECIGEREYPPVCVHAAAGLPVWLEYLALVAPAAPSPPVDVRLAMLADTCPMGHGCGCGSVARLCSAPDHPLAVFRPACLSCVARSEWAAGVDPIG